MIKITLQLLALWVLFVALQPTIRAQSIIGGTDRDPSAVLELNSQNKGFLLPRMSREDRDQIPYPATGLMIFNTTATCVDVNVGVPAAPIWRCLTAPAGIGGLHCEAAANAGVLTVGQPAVGVSAQIPYSGGLGDAYASHITTSTEVAGLTATLLAGNFSYGTGSVAYQITGIPSAVGVAKFNLVVGNQQCTLSREILPAGEISALNCSNIAQYGLLYAPMVASGVSCAVPYSGGNGGTFGQQSIPSSGVQGLIATLEPGILSLGNGQFTFTISGTPDCIGSAHFNLTIGGQSCTFTLEVISQTASITELQCALSLNAGTLTASQEAINVSSLIPYTGGNGSMYPVLAINSMGVIGLTANLMPDTLACGEGNLLFNISGSPACDGTAVFLIEIGGQTCTLVREVESSEGIITDIHCENYSVNGSIVIDTDTDGVSISIPYSGSNGGSYGSLSFNSSGVTGLSLSTNGGFFDCEEGLLSLAMAGIPSQPGTLVFNLDIGSQSCILSIEIPNCGVYIEEGIWKGFMCHNLGANYDANPFTPSWELIGNYYQWGRNPNCFGRDEETPCSGDVYGASAPWGNTESTDNNGSIIGWSNQNPPNDAWTDNVKTADDPCPPGFRVPTKTEWDGVANNLLNQRTMVGSWASSTTNYSSGHYFGTSLFLPTTGYRNFTDGRLNLRGSHGYYWSSTSSLDMDAWLMYFRENDAQTDSNTNRRTYGISVRCVVE